MTAVSKDKNPAPWLRRNRALRVRRALPVSLCICVSILAACQPDVSKDDPKTSSQASLPIVTTASGPRSEPKRSSRVAYSLGIVGYNYTEVGIDDYSVNGIGAFNLGVSTEDAGGGSTICCFGWVPTAKLPMRIRIEWTRGDDKWCRKTTMLTDPGPLEPTTFEVHFYPDRHIEVAVTDKYSAPRLKLAGTGGGYRIGKDVRLENAEAQRLDSLAAECRVGPFPIGGS